MNKNEDSIYQNLWDADKAALRGKFILVKTCIIKEGKDRRNNLTFYFKTVKGKKKSKLKPPKERNNKN